MTFRKTFFRLFFPFISFFGLPFFYTPVIAYVYATDFTLSIRLIVILVLTEIVCGLIKLVYAKNRPISMKRQTLLQRYNAGSFPSIHSARIMALFIGMNSFFTTTLSILVAFLMVIAVGYSRVYLKKHDVIDVLGGYVIGGIMAVLMTWL